MCFERDIEGDQLACGHVICRPCREVVGVVSPCPVSALCDGKALVEAGETPAQACCRLKKQIVTLDAAASLEVNKLEARLDSFQRELEASQAEPNAWLHEQARSLSTHNFEQFKDLFRVWKGTHFVISMKVINGEVRELVYHNKGEYHKLKIDNGLIHTHIRNRFSEVSDYESYSLVTYPYVSYKFRYTCAGRETREISEPKILIGALNRCLLDKKRAADREEIHTKTQSLLRAHEASLELLGRQLKQFEQKLELLERKLETYSDYPAAVRTSAKVCS